MYPQDMFGLVNGRDEIQVKHALTASCAFMQQELMGDGCRSAHLAPALRPWHILAMLS
jgi:hypothetical protein